MKNLLVIIFLVICILLPAFHFKLLFYELKIEVYRTYLQGFDDTVMRNILVVVCYCCIEVYKTYRGVLIKLLLHIINLCEY